MHFRQNMRLLFVICFLLQKCLCDDHQGASAQEMANDRANQHSLKIIANIPRYGGDSEMDEDDFDFSEEPPAYWLGIAGLVAIPLVFVALSVLFCPFFTVCRCAKCCCCRKKKPKEPITKFQIYFPYALIFCCSVVIVAMAGIAYGANIDFSGALLHNEGEGNKGSLFNVMLTLLEDGSDKMDDIKTATLDIKNSIIFVVNGVQSILNDTSVLSLGTGSLISMLSSISAIWNGYNVTTTYNGDTYSFPCAFCTTFSAKVANISAQIEEQVGPIFSDLNNTVNSIGSSLVDVEATILEQMDEFVNATDDAAEQLSDFRVEVVDSRSDVDTVNGHRELAYNVLFVIPLLPIVFILCGGILKKPVCFTCAYICLWFSCTLMWLLLALHLPIAVLLNDSCDFIDVVEANVTYYVDGEPGKVFKACLTNDRLTDALGVSDSLNFTNEITFPSLGNITQQFEFSAFTDFEGEAMATNASTFYGAGDDALDGINTFVTNSPNYGNPGLPTSFDRSTVATLDTTQYYTAGTTPQLSMEDLKDVMMAEANSISAFNRTVYKIRANLSSVADQAASIETATKELAARVDNASVLLNPLIAAVDDMMDTARCGFIGVAYYDTKSVMCEAVLGSLARIVISMLVIAVLSWFSCWFSFKLVRKVEWWHKQKEQELEEKRQSAAQANKPSIIVMASAPDQFRYQPGGNQIHAKQLEF